MLDLCLPCKEKGKFRAPYKVVKGVPMCGGCVADHETGSASEAMGKAETASRNKNASGADESGESRDGGTRAVSNPGPIQENIAKERNRMLDPDTIEAIERDAAAGLSLTEIQKKHSVSWPTAKRYAGNAVSKKGTRPAGGGDTSSKSASAAKRASSNGHFDVKLSAEGMDAVWSNLPAEKKAELLGHL